MNEEMQRLELIKENEALKQQLRQYEEIYKPVYERYMAEYKVKALNEYGIRDNVDFWAAKLTGKTIKEIDEQAKQLAVDLRVEQRPRYVDPAIKGNGARYKPSPRTPEDVGRKAYERLKDSGLIPNTPGGSYGNNARYAKKVTVIKAESSLADFPKEKKLGVVNRVRKLFGRR
jgi:hypothetical protein